MKLYEALGYLEELVNTIELVCDQCREGTQTIDEAMDFECFIEDALDGKYKEALEVLKGVCGVSVRTGA